MRKIIWLSFLFSSLFLQAQEMYNLNAIEFKKAIESRDVIVLDVRTSQELSSGIIANSSLIDYYDPKFTEKIKLIQKDKEVFVYCRSGGRSANAAKLLAQQGQYKVYNLKGGITAWKKAGFPIEKLNNEADDNIQRLGISDFDKLLETNDYVLADFHTQWCVPCKKMIPILDEYEKESGLKIIRIDVDSAEELSEKYQIEAVPTLILFHQSKSVWRNSGFMTKEDLQKNINQYRK